MLISRYPSTEPKYATVINYRIRALYSARFQEHISSEDFDRAMEFYDADWSEDAAFRGVENIVSYVGWGHTLT